MEFHIASERLRYLPDDGQAQSGTRHVTSGGRTQEPVEDVGPILCCHSRALIAGAQLAGGSWSAGTKKPGRLLDSEVFLTFGR